MEIMTIHVSSFLRLFILLLLSSSANAMFITHHLAYLASLEQECSCPAESEARLLEALIWLQEGKNLDLSAKDPHNDALYYATVSGSSPLVNALIKAGASKEVVYVHNRKLTTFPELVKLFAIKLNDDVKHAPKKPKKPIVEKLASNKKPPAPIVEKLAPGNKRPATVEVDSPQRKKLKLNHEGGPELQPWTPLQDSFDFSLGNILVLPSGDSITDILGFSGSL